MSLLQEQTLERFVEVVGKKTLNEYTKLTGIERTRLFRLFHGAEMKLSEFECLQKTITEEGGQAVGWENIVSLSSFQQSYRDEKVSQGLAVQIERSKRLQNLLSEMGANSEKMAKSSQRSAA